MTRYQCPECQADDGFWESFEVTGWQTLGSDLEEDGGDRDIDWDLLVTDGVIHCEGCDWEGTREQLVVLDIEGNPLKPQVPGQLDITVL